MPDTEIARDMFVFTRPPAAETADARLRPEFYLVGRAAAGDREAFNDLYKMFAPMVHGIVLTSVPYQEAPDLVQEVFITAYEKLHSLREPNAFGGWLARIARNRAAEFHRQRRPSEEVSDDMGGPKSATAEAAEILEVIRSMPDTYRETLILRLVEGMTGVEIAEMTGRTHDSVRVNLHRGMEILRQKLGITRRRK